MSLAATLDVGEGKNSGPVFLFNYKGIEIHGAMHDKGVFNSSPAIDVDLRQTLLYSTVA